MINIIPDSITQYFYNLTTHQPYNFQTQTITRILNHQDTILRAPTGSGKTETAIAPFLFAKTLNLDFPNKLIYVVPLRTLANSLRQRAEILIDRWSQVHQLPCPIIVTLQTGKTQKTRVLRVILFFVLLTRC